MSILLVFLLFRQFYGLFYFIFFDDWFYLTQANIGHLKLVLIDDPSQAAIKQLHSSTQCSLSKHTHSLKKGRTQMD